MDSPVEGAQGSASGPSGKINTELILASKHLDNLTKKVEHMQSDWADTSHVGEVGKKFKSHQKAAKSLPSSSTEASARESSSTLRKPTDGDGVLNLDQYLLEAKRKEEEPSKSVFIYLRYDGRLFLCLAPHPRRLA